jgi:subtilase family serine protease
MQCDALTLDQLVGPRRLGKPQRRGAAPEISGWTPADLEAAYNLPSSSKGAGQVVAIVDAFDNPDVATDLATYRSEFNLPKANFTKYNEKGEKGSYPKACPKTGPDAGWCVEIDLDVEMLSASCPNCTIYLLEAKNNSSKNLEIAEKEAVTLGATIISNSWGGGAGGRSGGAFNTAGITYLASAGDGGYGMQDPADWHEVVSVGGTLLHFASSAYSETVWPDTGGGCSVVSKPAWQDDPKCSKRTGNDVSAVAWAVAEYDTYNTNSTGWFEEGGTSVSSPLIAGVFGLAGNSNKQHGGENFWTLSAKDQAKDFHSQITGTDNRCPSEYTGTYLCDGDTGQYKTYSGPAGWGSPNGIGAF